MKKTKYLVLSAAAILAVGCKGNGKLPAIEPENADAVVGKIVDKIDERREAFEGEDQKVPYNTLTYKETGSLSQESLSYSEGKTSLKEEYVTEAGVDMESLNGYMHFSDTGNSPKNAGGEYTNDRTMYLTYQNSKLYVPENLNGNKVIEEKPVEMSKKEAASVLHDAYDGDIPFYNNSKKVKYFSLLELLEGKNNEDTMSIWSTLIMSVSTTLGIETPTQWYSVASLHEIVPVMNDKLENYGFIAVLEKSLEDGGYWRDGSSIDYYYGSKGEGSLQASYDIKLITSKNMKEDIVTTGEVKITFTYEDYYLASLSIDARTEMLKYSGKDPTGEYNNRHIVQNIEITQKNTASAPNLDEFEDMYE